MKSSLLVGLVGLLCGLGGSVGAVMLRGSPEPTLAQNLAALSDSTIAADSLRPAAHAPGVSAEGADSAIFADPIAGVHMPAPLAHADAAVGEAEEPHDTTMVDAESGASVPPTTEPTVIEGRKLAKIFAAMRPREAALVLDQMQDGEIQAVLGFLGDRQAAAILGSLPPERVAAISRAVIHSGRGATQ